MCYAHIPAVLQNALVCWSSLPKDSVELGTVQDLKCLGMCSSPAHASVIMLRPFPSSNMCQLHNTNLLAVALAAICNQANVNVYMVVQWSHDSCASAVAHAQACIFHGILRQMVGFLQDHFTRFGYIMDVYFITFSL